MGRSVRDGGSLPAYQCAAGRRSEDVAVGARAYDLYGEPVEEGPAVLRYGHSGLLHLQEIEGGHNIDEPTRASFSESYLLAYSPAADAAAAAKDVEDQEPVRICALAFGAAACGRGDEEDAHDSEMRGGKIRVGRVGWIE